SPRVGAVLLAAAASGRPTLTGLGARGVRAAENARLVMVAADGRVGFAHPLLAAAIYQTATAEERRRAHELLAAESAELEERARHPAPARPGPHQTGPRL